MISSREIPHYREEQFSSAALGNNAFDYAERSALHPEPYLRLAPLRQYNSAAEALNALRWSSSPAFEIIEDGRLKSFAGLENFLLFPNPANRDPCPVFIFDNHNHAFYFWHLCLHNGFQNLRHGTPRSQTKSHRPPFALVHIDQHKDSRIPATLPDSRTINDADALHAYTNEILNVGNFIPPALKTGLLDHVINIDSSARLQSALDSAPPENFILDLDLDFFAPELDYIPRAAKITLFKKLLPTACLVTIATSPYFLDQQKVPDLLREILA